MSLTKLERRTDENCRSLRKFINKFVQERKSEGQVKTDACDVLTLFLQTPEVFTDDVIIDELMDFILAGSQTSSLLT